jgi:hypothetical protein
MRTFFGRLLTVVVVATTTWAVAGVGSPAAAAYGTTAAASWVPNGTVFAMAQSGGRIYLGGSFTSLTDPTTGTTVARARLAAVDASTGALVTDWNPGADGTVRALAVGDSGTIYAGGSFTTAAGVAASRLAAITPTGAPVPGWAATANSTVRDILVDPTGIYVGGQFGAINGTKRGRLARLAPATGAVDTTFNAQVAGGIVQAIAKAGDSLVIGGTFSTLSGAPRPFSGSVALSTGAVTAWAPAAQCDTCPVLDIATDGTRVYEAVGGSGGRVVALSLSSGNRVWGRSGDGNVQAVAVHNGVVYAGGHFSTFLQQPQRQLVQLSATTGTVLSYTIPFTGSDAIGIWVILVDATALRIGGGFRLANNPAARYASFPTS